MVNKVCSILIFITFLSSCSEKGTKVEVNTPTQANDDESKALIIEGEKKPLIKILPDDVLKIWARADGAPGMYVNDNGDIVGFYVDLEKAVMKEMGQKYELCAYSDLGPLIQNIKTGEAHSALAAFDVPDFRALAHLSDSYEDLEYVIFLREENGDTIPREPEEAIKYLYGKKVGVQTRGHIYQMLRNHKEIEIAEYPTTTEALEALNSGDVDAVPDVDRIGRYYSQKNNWNIRVASQPILSFRTVTGFSKALDYSLVERYNKALNTLIDNGTVEKLFNTHFNK